MSLSNPHFTQSQLESFIERQIYLSPEKMLFLDIIIEDDPGEEEEKEDIVPYQLTKGALILDMKVQDIKVHV